MWLKPVFYVTFAISGLVVTFYSVGKFMFFLSEPQNHHGKEDESPVAQALFVNMILLSCFVLQHTFMVLPGVKNFLSKWGLDVISRSLYTITTSILLMVLIKYWQTIPHIILWNFDTSQWLSWIFFVTVHVFAWSIIYTGCLFMDISELLGLKQVYYSLRSMPDPIHFKSNDLQRLYGHTRHPSFTALIFILWVCPSMTLDRLVLASVLTVYMFLMWKTDKYDLNYQQAQYVKKTGELYNLH